MTTVPPIAASDIWQAVMDRADHQCQCTHTGHPGHRGGRCHTSGWTSPSEATVLADVRLIAGPAHPGPRPERVIDRTPIDQLQAWCLPCWTHEVKRARKATADAPPQTDSLF